jgi:sugar phosphate permease
MMTAVANWFQKRVGIALGIMACGFGASGLIVPFIVKLIDVYGWRIALIILGVVMCLIGLPLSFVIRNRPEQYGYLPDGETSADLGSKLPVQIEQTKIGIKSMLKNRSFVYLNLVEMVRMLTTTAVVIHVMPYLGSIGMSRVTAGLVAAGIPLCSIIGRFSFGWLSDVLEKRYMLAAAFVCLGAGMLAFCFANKIWAAILFLLLFPSGFGGIMVLRGSIVREYFGRDSFGTMIGIILGAASIGGLIGPTLAGWVYDTLGSYQVAWLVFLGLIGCSVILIWRIK